MTLEALKSLRARITAARVAHLATADDPAVSDEVADAALRASDECGRAQRWCDVAIAKVRRGEPSSVGPEGDALLAKY